MTNKRRFNDNNILHERSCDVEDKKNMTKNGTLRNTVQKDGTQKIENPCKWYCNRYSPYFLGVPPSEKANILGALNWHQVS
jgi:hypothetical protein